MAASTRFSFRASDRDMNLPKIVWRPDSTAVTVQFFNFYKYSTSVYNSFGINCKNNFIDRLKWIFTYIVLGMLQISSMSKITEEPKYLFGLLACEIIKSFLYS